MFLDPHTSTWKAGFQYLESRIDSHPEARRDDQRFERAELNAFDYARNPSDLAGGEDTDLDPHILDAADPFLDFLRDHAPLIHPLLSVSASCFSPDFVNQYSDQNIGLLTKN